MRTALSIVYDEATHGILILNEYGAQDITRFADNVEVEYNEDGVGAKLTATFSVIINPDLE